MLYPTEPLLLLAPILIVFDIFLFDRLLKVRVPVFMTSLPLSVSMVLFMVFVFGVLCDSLPSLFCAGTSTSTTFLSTADIVAPLKFVLPYVFIATAPPFSDVTCVCVKLSL